MLHLLASSTVSKFFSRSFLGLALFLSVTVAHAAAPVFTPINDPLATSAGTQVNGINGAFLVGTYFGSNFTSHGFIFNGTGFVTLDDPNATYTNVRGVDGVNVVGYSTNNFGNQHGFVYNSNGLVEFDVAGGEDTTAAYDISGTNVVGNYFTDSASHGFIYSLTDSSTIPLDEPEASDTGGGTYAQGIDGTIVVGYYYTGNQMAAPPTVIAHGFFYNSNTGNFTTLDDPKAGTGPYEGTYATGVSKGVIVGYYYKGQTVIGFVYDTNGKFTDVAKSGAGDTYLYAIDGNNVVGYTQPGGMGDNAYDSSGFVTTIALGGGNTTSAPVVASNPSNKTTAVGANVTFSAGLSVGIPIAKEQWQILINSTWTNITASMTVGTTKVAFTGFNTLSLTVVKPNAALDGKAFRLLAFNSAGTVVSGGATLSVSVPTLTVSSISVLNLSNTTVSSIDGVYLPFANQTVVLMVTAGGASNLTYQWALNGKALSKATAASYTITKFLVGNSGNYTVVVTHPASGVTKSSDPVTVAIATAPVFTTNPANLTIVDGHSGTFSVNVTGSPAPAIQWQVSTNGVTWNNMDNNAYYSGVNSPILTVHGVLPDLSGNFNYRAVATSPLNTPAVVSKSARLTVVSSSLTAGQITGNYSSAPLSNDAYYILANQGVGLSVSPIASGPGTISYQWFLNGVAISKATGSAYNIKFAAASAGNYTVVVKSSLLLDSLTRGPVSLALAVLPKITTSPASVSVASNGSTTFTVTFTGSPAPVVSWQSSTDKGKTWSFVSDGGDFSTSSTATLHVTGDAALNGRQFRAIVSSTAFGSSATSSAATLTVTTPPPPPLDPALQGKYTIKTLHVSALSGLINTDITPLPTAATKFSVTLDKNGLAGTSIPAAADNLVTAIGPGSSVTLSPTSPPTQTSYNAKISGKVVIVLGSIDYNIALDNTQSTASAGFSGSNLVVTVVATGAITQAGTSAGSGTATVTITLSK